MRESAVIRLLDDELVWYPPGSSAEPRALRDEAESDQLAAVVAALAIGTTFADDDKIGGVVDNRIPVAMQSLQQSAFANHVGGTGRLFRRQKAGGGHCTRKNISLLDVDPHAT